MAGAQDKMPQEPEMGNTGKGEWMGEESDSLVDEMVQRGQKRRWSNTRGASSHQRVQRSNPEVSEVSQGKLPGDGLMEDNVEDPTLLQLLVKSVT